MIHLIRPFKAVFTFFMLITAVGCLLSPLLFAETETDSLVEYIIEVHDKATNCKPCITRQRAQDYADQIEASSISWWGPGKMDYCVGLIQWESDGFINSIDKNGSSKTILPPSMWCFGLGKLKVATANSFVKYQLGWNTTHITGRELLYDYRLNLDLSIAHLAWCVDQKGGSVRRGMNSYRAGCRGEIKGNYWITVTMPWGEKVRKQYADWVFDCVNQWREFKMKGGAR